MKAIIAFITLSLIFLFAGSVGFCEEEDPTIAEASLILTESGQSLEIPADSWLFERSLAAEALRRLRECEKDVKEKLLPGILPEAKWDTAFAGALEGVGDNLAIAHEKSFSPLLLGGRINHWAVQWQYKTPMKRAIQRLKHIDCNIRLDLNLVCKAIDGVANFCENDANKETKSQFFNAMRRIKAAAETMLEQVNSTSDTLTQTYRLNETELDRLFEEMMLDRLFADVVVARLRKKGQDLTHLSNANGPQLLMVANDIRNEVKNESLDPSSVVAIRTKITETVPNFPKADLDALTVWPVETPILDLIKLRLAFFTGQKDLWHQRREAYLKAAEALVTVNEEGTLTERLATVRAALKGADVNYSIVCKITKVSTQKEKVPFNILSYIPF